MTVSTLLLPRGLYALVDDGVRPEVPLLQKVRWVLDGGARVLQLRLKRTALREAVSLCREAVALCRHAGAVCIVNDRVDLVMLSGAHGVHLGEEDLPVAEARRLLGPHILLGATVRHAEGARRALEQGADHVGMGPVFQTNTKVVTHPALGSEGLRREVRQSPLPVVAIAGIGLHNIREVAAAGAHAAAVASDLLCADDPVARTRALVEAFGEVEQDDRSRKVP